MKLCSKVFFYILLCFGCYSCHNHSRKPAENTRIVRLNLKSEPPTMDPRKGGDVISSHMHFLLFEGLVKLNHDRSIAPAQAESYEISEDGITYTFKMRNTKWSNGTQVTAYDFEKAWKDILKPDFPAQNAHLLYPIKNAEAAKKGLAPIEAVGIHAQDSSTFIITLEKPTPYFLDLVSFCVFFPIHSENDQAFPDWAYNAGEHYICNGPFILKEWKHHNEIIAIKNPNYWDTTRVLPDAIHFSMIDNEMTALQMFENHQLDMIGEPLSPIPIDAIAKLNSEGKLQKFSVAATTMLAFNLDNPPLHNIHIRKALSYALNRKEIVENITQMGETIATNAVPPILKNFRNESFFEDYALAEAQEYFEKGLKETGYTREDFNKFIYHYAISDIHHNMAQAIQQQWKQVFGFTIQLEMLEHKVLMDKLTKGDYHIGQTAWVAQYNDQMNILERFKYKTNVKNYANWENADFIELLEASFYVSGNERLEILETAEKIFLDEMPICPIYHWDMAFMVQPYLNDVGITPIGDIVFEELNLDMKGAFR